METEGLKNVDPDLRVSHLGVSLFIIMQVLAPYDAEDARGLLKAAIRDPDPVVFLENEILYGQAFPVAAEVLDKDFLLPLNKSKV